MSFLELFEVYTNTEETNIFDHYVPRLLLNRWRIADRGPDRGYVQRWHRPTEKISKEPISLVAGDTDWDLSKSKGSPSDFVRKKLFSELLEDKGSFVIKLLNSRDIPDLTFLEESTLAIFIGHQITRVPAFRLSLSHFFSLGMSNGSLKLSDFGNKRALIDKVARNSIGMTYENFLSETCPIEIDARPQTLLLSLVIASCIGEKIYKGNDFHILEIPNDSSDEFVISDNPVVLLDFERKDILRFVPWWEIGERDILIFMPISPRKGILFSKRKFGNGPVVNDSEDLVRLFNFGQYLCCSYEVFSRNLEVLKRHSRIYANELRRLRLSPSLLVQS